MGGGILGSIIGAVSGACSCGTTLEEPMQTMSKLSQ